MTIFYLLSRSARETSIARLRLGAVTKSLERAGLRTVGLVLAQLERDPKGLLGIAGVTKEDQILVSERIRVLEVDRDGNVKWDRYEQELSDELPSQTPSVLRAIARAGTAPEYDAADTRKMVPAVEVTSGAGFLAAFPEVIDAIVRTRENLADKLILAERLAKQPHERKSLDEIAKAIPKSITRERIRQREQILLNLLSQALLFGRSKRLGLSFRESFRRYWASASESFKGRDRMSFSEFFDCLQQTWGVRPEQLFGHLPLITSILTSKATIPESIRSHLKRDPKVFKPLSEATKSLPISQLSGRAAGELAAYGISTVGDLFAAVRRGEVPDASTKAGRSAESVLDAVLDGMLHDDEVDWSRVEARLGLERLPLQDPLIPKDFLDNISFDLGRIIDASSISRRASEIFRLRIAVGKENRPTLAEAAVALGTHGPTIKREETLLLRTLNDQLVQGDVSECDVLFSPRFLQFWREAVEVYQLANGDFAGFRQLLLLKWGVTDAPPVSLEILWAVLDEYPSSRPRSAWKRTRRDRSVMPKKAPDAVVILRGFRRVH